MQAGKLSLCLVIALVTNTYPVVQVIEKGLTWNQRGLIETPISERVVQSSVFFTKAPLLPPPSPIPILAYMLHHWAYAWNWQPLNLLLPQMNMTATTSGWRKMNTATSTSSSLDEKTSERPRASAVTSTTPTCWLSKTPLRTSGSIVSLAIMGEYWTPRGYAKGYRWC